LDLHGAYLIEPELLQDERGFFARVYCSEEFEQNGLNPRVAQCSTSFNRKRGTLRGMHYQIAPYAEVKLVRCTMGAIYDVIIDLRPKSPSYMKWIAVELSSTNRRSMYVPEGFAHGYQTLEDNTEVYYQISEAYHPDHARGVRWDDPSIGIKWPLADPILSDKDCSYPDIEPEGERTNL
jgi:dTDP-4-dehydrorhamnose 3,5-epimerase